MRREHSISSLVYHHLFPHPTSSDPPDFATHLAKHLVAEVRIETQRFYGGLETVEARYPGLNYSHPPHRKRLSRFPHHARLFRAFDELGLTEHEIGMLCRWEGTLWARQRYERDEGITVLDTTGSEIQPWVDRRPKRDRWKASEKRASQIKVKTDIEVEISDRASAHGRPGTASAQAVSRGDETMLDASAQPEESDEDDDEDDDDDIESVGIELNARLIAAVAAREQQGLGSDIALDPAWEAFLKEAAENGTPLMSDMTSTLQAQAIQQAINAARATSSAGQGGQQSRTVLQR